jgi:hypothetical protein
VAAAADSVVCDGVEDHCVCFYCSTGYKAVRVGGEQVFITAVPIIKLFARGVKLTRVPIERPYTEYFLQKCPILLCKSIFAGVKILRSCKKLWFPL